MLAAGTTLGPYRIVGALGAGGMGEVYRAHDPRLGRDVAIKVLPPRSAFSPDARARFEREARTISQLSHPHICALHDIGREGETDYLVMELLEGETLAHRIARGPLPVGDVLKLGAEIASALDRAHAAGVVHRDLKPGNVMLTKSGAKLMDFGLARVGAAPASGSDSALSASPTVTQPLTSEGAIVGTFQYMAPEQLEGKDADARSDIWALGCVLYEMATGKRAFAGESQASLIGAIMRDEPRPISELQPLTPPALGHVVARCLAKDPADRWQSARDVASVLEMARTESGVTMALAATAPNGVRRWAIAVAALVLAAVAVAVVAHLVWPQHVKQPSYHRLTFQRGYFSNARFAADGKSVFYSARWEDDPFDVFEVPVDKLRSRSLGLRGRSLSAVSSTGMLAVAQNPGYGSEQHLFRVLSTVPGSGGAPRAAVEDVSVSDWAPDGRTLAVVRRAGGERRVEMPPGRVLLRTDRPISVLRVSPDSHRIALLEHEYNDLHGAVVVIDDRGHEVVRTREWIDVRGLAWAPGGREVWFTAQMSNAPVHELRAVTLNGEVRTVLRGPMDMVVRDISRDGRVLLTVDAVRYGARGQGAGEAQEHELSWLDWTVPKDISRDGRTLLFDEEGEGDALYSVYLRSMTGGPPTRLGEGPALALSPDGQWVLVMRFTRPQRLALLPTGAGDSIAVSPGPIVQYAVANWLPDGRRIVFEGSEAGQPGRIYVQLLPDGKPLAITPPGVDARSVNRVMCSPDGRWVAALTSAGRLTLYPVEGGAPRDVAKLGSDEWLAQWSADGRSVFVNRIGTRLEISRLDLATGGRTPWKTFSLADPAGTDLESPQITPDGGSYAYWYARFLQTLFVVDGLK